MNEDSSALQKAIKNRWSKAGGPKIQRYVSKFWERRQQERKITAVVKGNHGNYTVSIDAGQDMLDSVCSCYIGKHGGCHHCAALGLTFLAEPDSFTLIETVAVTAVQDLDSLKAHLNSVTLDEMVKQLRAHGITQKAFCESIGMSTRHLAAVKSSELRNRRFHELGAIKLAVLWTLEKVNKK